VGWEKIRCNLKEGRKKACKFLRLPPLLLQYLPRGGKKMEKKGHEGMHQKARRKGESQMLKRFEGKREKGANKHRPREKLGGGPKREKNTNKGGRGEKRVQIESLSRGET